MPGRKGDRGDSTGQQVRVEGKDQRDLSFLVVKALISNLFDHQKRTYYIYSDTYSLQSDDYTSLYLMNV